MEKSRTRSRTLTIAVAGSIGALAALWAAIEPRADPVDAAGADAEAAPAPGQAGAAPVGDLSVAEPFRTARTPPPEPRIHGRLIDLSTGLSIPGWRIRLQAPAEPRALDFAIELANLEIGDTCKIELDTALRNALESVRSEELEPVARVEEAVIQADHNVQPVVLDIAPVVLVSSPLVQRITDAMVERHVISFHFVPTIPPQGLEVGLAALLTGSEARESLAQILELNATAAILTARGLDRRGGAPIRASAHTEPRVLSETVTDADGYFELPCADVAGAWLEAPPQDGRYVEPATFDLPAPDSACAEEIVWKVELRRGGIFRGRVLDERTSEPVPDLEVRLSFQRGGRWSLRTDAEGRCESAEPFPEGRVSVSFLHGAERVPLASEVSSFDFQPASAPAEEPVFRVAIGPTFRFEVTGPDGAGLSHLRVRFHGLEPESGIGDDANLFAEWRDLSNGDPRSVRFPLRGRRRDGGPVRAEIRTEDGSLGGTTEVPNTFGISPWVVRAALTARATVSGTIRGPSGRPIQGATVFARERGGSEAGLAAVVFTDAEGRYEIRGLDPVDVRVIEVQHETLGSRALPVALRPGETQTLDVDL